MYMYVGVKVVYARMVIYMYVHYDLRLTLYMYTFSTSMQLMKMLLVHEQYLSMYTYVLLLQHSTVQVTQNLYASVEYKRFYL